MSEKTDEEIAELVQQGDVESFGLLMKRYEKKLSRYGKKFLADHDDVDDLVQEVFIKAYSNMHSFDPSRRFSPWIYRVAHNTFVNALKKKWREAVLPFDFDLILPHAVATETADEGTRRDDDRRLLDQCLSELDAKYREPLVLYYYEELDYTEIAEVLHIPLSTLGVRLRRARARMKELVSKKDPHYEQ